MGRKQNIAKTPSRASADETPLILDDQGPGLDKKTLAKLFDFREARLPFRKFSSTKLSQLLKKSERERERIEGLIEVQRPGIDDAHARSLQTHADALSDYKREIVGELLGRKASRKKAVGLRKAPGIDDAATELVTLDVRESAIWNVIQRGAKGRQFCRELDEANIRIERKGVWKGAPPTYTAAYDAGRPWRHRIEDMKSKIKQKAKLAKLAEKLASE